MSKPVRQVTITTLDEKSGTVKAVFDTGSFYSILRADKVPEGAAVLERKKPLVLKAAAQDTRLTVTAEVVLIMKLGDKEIEDVVSVSSDLAQEMLVGAGTMQRWDISVLNRNGNTEVDIGTDRRDPEVNEVV